MSQGGGIVLDASATLAWLFDEDKSAASIQKRLDRHALITPSLWRLEVVNVVLVRQRRKLLDEAQAAHLLQLLDDLPIALVDEPDTRTAAGLAGIARPHQLTAYDAVYLDLAMRSGLPLLTRDQALKHAAARAGVKLVA